MHDQSYLPTRQDVIGLLKIIAVARRLCRDLPDEGASEAQMSECLERICEDWGISEAELFPAAVMFRDLH